MAEETSLTLFDFTGADAAQGWQTVNDGVTGGVSEGKFKITGELITAYQSKSETKAV